MGKFFISQTSYQIYFKKSGKIKEIFAYNFTGHYLIKENNSYSSPEYTEDYKIEDISINYVSNLSDYLFSAEFIPTNIQLHEIIINNNENCPQGFIEADIMESSFINLSATNFKICFLKEDISEIRYFLDNTSLNLEENLNFIGISPTFNLHSNL